MGWRSIVDHLPADHRQTNEKIFDAVLCNRQEVFFTHDQIGALAQFDPALRMFFEGQMCAVDRAGPSCLLARNPLVGAMSSPVSLSRLAMETQRACNGSITLPSDPIVIGRMLVAVGAASEDGRPAH
jgi:hypothetical protein